MPHLEPAQEALLTALVEAARSNPREPFAALYMDQGGVIIHPALPRDYDFYWGDLLTLASAELVAVPVTLHLNGAFPGVVFSATGDPQLLGRSISGLHHDNPKLDTLLVDSMTSMCAMMMGWGIMVLAATWFALRRGRSWSYWALLVSGLIALVYYVVISVDYASQGATWADGLQSVLIVSIPLFLGIIAGGVALVRRSPSEPVRTTGG
jgi:hypothetical protein